MLPYGIFRFSYSFYHWTLRPMHSMTKLIDLMMQHCLHFIILNMLVELILTLEVFILGIVLKFNLPKGIVFSFLFVMYFLVSFLVLQSS